MSKIIKLSELFTKTLREDPADAEVDSHKLLVRAGYIRQVAPGIFTWLPLGLKVLDKVTSIIDEEMQKIGCQKVHFPSLLPREPFDKTNRWNEYGNNIFRLKDRKNADYLLAPTHEEMFTLLAKDMSNSYKDLPLSLYQTQIKYRDEARPRAGLLRGREFIMKDAYSFDIDEESLKNSYNLQRQAYINIFTRLQLDFQIVQAMSGAMGGSQSEEFLSPTDVGEDTYVVAKSGYAANVEAAKIKVPDDLEAAKTADFTNFPEIQSIKTPNVTSIDEVTKYLNQNYADNKTLNNDLDVNSITQKSESFDNSLKLNSNSNVDKWNTKDLLKAVYITLVHPEESEFARDKTKTKEVIVIYIPGNRNIDLKRVDALFSPCEVAQSSSDELKLYPELVTGFVGPIAGDNSMPRQFFDSTVFLGSNWVTGGNTVDFHRLNVVAGRDFDVNENNRISVIEIEEGDEAFDGSGAFEIKRGVEIGHIFALGDKYTKAFEWTVLDENGKSVTPLMGSYGIGVTRIVALLAQNYNDEFGLKWPVQISPANVHIVVIGKDDEVFQKAQDFANRLSNTDVEVILDDRKGVAPGVKFKDAELIGVPFIVVFGKGLNDDIPNIEIKTRQNGEKTNIPLQSAFDELIKIIKVNFE